MFTGIGIGFVWGLLRLPYDTEFVPTLVMHVGAPFLIFSTLTKLTVDPAAFGIFAGYSVLALAGMALVGAILLRLLRYRVQENILPVTYPNAGNMGLPVSLYAFGEAGLALGIAYFSVAAVSQFVLSPLVYLGRFSVVALLRMPTIWAIAIALVFMTTDTGLPPWAANSVELLGAITIPLMLFALGVSLTRIRVRNFREAIILTVLRLGLGIGVGFGLSWVFDLEGAARGVLILISSMPAAVFSYLFAATADRSPEAIAGLVFTSTIVSFVTLPLLLALILG